MSQLERRLHRLCLCTLAVLAACSAQHGPRKVDSPEGSSLGKLVHDVFTEMERDAELRCVCYVADGTYASEDACMHEVGRGADAIACLEHAFDDGAHEELRDAFECMLLARLETNECLETASCNDQLAVCFAAPRDCPTVDPVLLTQLARQCPGSIGTAR